MAFFVIVALLCVLPAPPGSAFENGVRPAVNDDIVFQVAAVFVFLPTLHNLFTGMAAIFGRG